jgi:transposase
MDILQAFDQPILIKRKIKLITKKSVAVTTTIARPVVVAASGPHKSHPMRDAIAALSVARVFVPPYSPDFNP